MQPIPRHLLIATALLAPRAANAQIAPAPSAPPSETLVLFAFEVRSAKDSGYRVQISSPPPVSPRP